MSTRPECVILIGVPGAGKTSFYRERFGATHHHLSKDLWPNARGREARQQRLLAEALAAGRSAVVDNVNAAASDRAPTIATARRHGARLVGYFFDVSTRAAVARNAERTGRARVPNVAIFRAAKQLEPPAREEGFDQLFRVTLAADRGFHVEEL